MQSGSDLGISTHQQLLLNVSEELKLPLGQIARLAELGQLNSKGDLPAIQSTADTALKLLDNYSLAVRLALQPELLEYEPVSVSSVLYDAERELDKHAKNYGVLLDLDIAGRFGPVMADRAALQAALVSLGVALIEALPATSRSRQLKLHLATHRAPSGIVAGLYSNTLSLSSAALKRGHQLKAARQPLTGFSHTSGAGIFVAENILSAMDLKLHVSRHNSLRGVGVVLQPNPQLQLV